MLNTLGKDLKLRLWTGSVDLLKIRCILTLFSVLFFTLLSAQDSVKVSSAPKVQIAVVGTAQIYSADRSFNDFVSGGTVKLIAKKYVPSAKTLILKALPKKEKYSSRANLAAYKNVRVDEKILATLRKISQKSLDQKGKFQNENSSEFFSSDAASRSIFIVPDSQNLAQKTFIFQDQIYNQAYFLLSEDRNHFCFNNRSITFGYSETYPLRPPPSVTF